MTKISTLYDVPELKSFLDRIGAVPRSLRQAVVEETRGQYWKDVAVVHISERGEIRVDPELPQYLPTDKERDDIEAAFKNVTLPKSTAVASIDGLPSEVKNKEIGKNLFIFQNEDGNVVMVHERTEVPDKKSGELKKVYLPWTPFDDGKWRRQEPDGRLPLYNRQEIKENTTIIGLHEGPKSAYRLTKMIRDGTIDQYPWGKHLKNMVHIGWVGGALNPGRTDWRALNKSGSVATVYIFADNDREGKQAVPNLAYRIRKRCVHVQFTDEWPKGWDFGDEWPHSMVRYYDKHNELLDPDDPRVNEEDVVRVDVGPTFRECCHPATWATDVLPNPSGQGRPIFDLRDEFMDEWVYSEGAQLYVNKWLPSNRLTERSFNKKVRPFSHAEVTSAILDRAYSGTHVKLAYEPPLHDKRIITLDGTSAINVYEQSNIEPVDPGGGMEGLTKAIQPWLDFSDYMFPEPEERHEVMRWEATLCAQLDVHMQYAQLWVSETHGIGKTARSSAISQIVGKNNTGYPSEKEITNSDFNGWMAHRRLVVCQEIYAGHSWKAYNELKSKITDPDINVNEKFEKSYRINNWVAVIANSNRKDALKMENSDRRWYVPKIIETKWSDAGYEALYQWFNRGGLSFLAYWASVFPQWCEWYYSDERCKAMGLERKALRFRYVKAKDPAPMTGEKKEMITASLDDPLREMGDFLDAFETDDKVAIPIKVLRQWLLAKCGKVFQSDLDLRKFAKTKRWQTLGKRIKFEGQMQPVLISPALWEERWENDLMISPEDLDYMRKFIKRPADVVYDQI